MEETKSVDENTFTRFMTVAFKYKKRYVKRIRNLYL